MKSKSRKNMGAPAKLQMSAMIDVVFLLLIFFLVVIKPEDVLAKLNASSPKPEETSEIRPELLNIDVHKESYVINGKRVSLEQMEALLIKSAKFSPRQSIIITCAYDSDHSRLIKCMDICAKAGLQNLSLFSR